MFVVKEVFLKKINLLQQEEAVSFSVLTTLNEHRGEKENRRAQGEKEKKGGRRRENALGQVMHFR